MSVLVLNYIRIYTAFADTAKSGFLPAAGAQALEMPQVLRLVADQ